MKKYIIEARGYNHIIISNRFQIIDGILFFYDDEENNYAIFVIKEWEAMRIEDEEFE